MSGLRLSQKIGFGLGCVLNALCAAMWFTYLLLYFDQVILSVVSIKGMIMSLQPLSGALYGPKLLGYHHDVWLSGQWTQHCTGRLVVRQTQ